jgi:mannose-1-phosphate guanylyltransferase
MHYKLFDTGAAKNRCAVILAGGDGLRLRSFVQKLRGDWLPKQYVKFLGEHSLLEATLQRVRTLIPPTRQFVVVTESHFDYAEVPQQLSNYPEVHVAAQPINRDTGLGLLLPLAHIYKIRPDSTVAVFPSDHFIVEEGLFLNHVDAAFGLVERDSTKIVLLGIAPTQAETDYGYILPSDRWHNAFPFGAREVKRFIEKPDPILARKLVLRGGFWNTMVMVFNLRTLLEQMRAVNPFAYRGFEQICDAVDTAGFSDAVRQVFVGSEPFNLSKGLLENLAMQARSLLVLPVRGVHWSDWGSEDRIMSTAGHALNYRFGLESSSNPFNALLERRAAGTA